MNNPEIQMLLGAVTLGLTGLIFPFALYFFKKNERLHEETKNKIGEHSTMLGVHEVRISSLEDWRKYSANTPQQNTINN